LGYGYAASVFAVTFFDAYEIFHTRSIPPWQPFEDAFMILPFTVVTSIALARELFARFAGRKGRRRAVSLGALGFFLGGVIGGTIAFATGLLLTLTIWSHDGLAIIGAVFMAIYSGIANAIVGAVIGVAVARRLRDAK
jgi:hypothetical protein